MEGEGGGEGEGVGLKEGRLRAGVRQTAASNPEFSM